MQKELIVKWKIKASELSAVLDLLPALVAQSRAEKGNLSYHIYQSADDASQLFLQESYVDNEALQAHKDSAHYQQIVAEQIIPHLEIRELSFVQKLF